MTAVVAESHAPLDAAVTTEDTLDAETGRGRPRKWSTTICLLTYFALAVIAFLPHGPLNPHVLPVAGPANPAGSDPLQMVWFLSWLPFALTHGLNIFHTNFFDYPQGVNLADNTSVPLLGLIAWPVTATLGPVASFNLLIRLAFALSGVSMFLVLRRWCSSIIAPFVGGLLYAFGPYTVGQALHLDLAFVPIPPLLVWCADELVRTRRMRMWRLGLLIGAAGAAEMLISPDVLSGCLVMVIIAGSALAVRHRHKLKELLSYLISTGAVAVATFALICGYMIVEMVAGPNHSVGAIIPPASLQGLHADLLGFVTPTSNQILAPHALAHLGNEMVANNLSENGTYLGLPLVILLVLFVRWLRNDPVVRVFAGMALAAVLISLGPTLTIGTINTHIPLPEAVFAHLPLLDNTIPARYDLYVLLFVSMILAIGIDRLWQRRSSTSLINETWRSRLGPLGTDARWARRARVGLVAGVAIASLLPTIPFRSQVPYWPRTLTGIIRQVVPPGSVVLSYPYPTPLHDDAMLWAAEAGVNYRLLGGYANIRFDNAGHRWPPLLSPPYVQELLGYTKTGDRWPAPGKLEPADLTALHVFLARYNVGAVVWWSGGHDPIPAYHYLALALGPPSFRAHRVAIWLPVNGHWRSPHDEP